MSRWERFSQMVLWCASVLCGILFLLSAPRNASAAISFGGVALPTPASGLSGAEQIWVSPSGTIYAANADKNANSRLTQYSPEGTLVGALAAPGARPGGIIVDPNREKIYFSAGSQGLVSSLNGTDVAAATTTIITGLSSPKGLALNPDGTRLYVANPGASNVKVYDTDAWSLLQTVTLPASSHISFPTAVAVASNGDFYVVDNRGSNIAAVTGTARVVKFAADGTLLGTVVSGLTDSAAANTADSPSGVAVDAADNLYVLMVGRAAGGSGSIRKYDLHGNFIEMFRGSGHSVMKRPQIGIFITADYKIYVSNTDLGSVLYFDQSIDAPQNFAVSSSGSVVHMTWSLIPDTRIEGISIVRSSSGYPTSMSDGTVVTSSTTGTNFDEMSVPDGTYYYSAFTRSLTGDYSVAATATIAIDTTPPSTPTSFSATASTSSVQLSWENPIVSDFSVVTLRRSTSTYPLSDTDGDMVTSSNMTTAYTDTELSEATYYYSLFASDVSGNTSTAATAVARIDVTPPSSPTAFTSTASGSNTLFTWINPTDDDFSSLTLRQSLFGFPETIMSGSAVTSSMVGTSFVETGMTDGTYYFSLFARDGSGNVSVAAQASTTIDTVAPLISAVTSTATSTGALITWTTDTVASSQLLYSPDSSYSSSTALLNVAPRVTSHAVYLTGLLNCATYFYKVASIDDSNNSATSTEEASFLTSGCPANASVLDSTTTRITIGEQGQAVIRDVEADASFTVSTPVGFVPVASYTLQSKTFLATDILRGLGSAGFVWQSAGVIALDLQVLTGPDATLRVFDEPVHLVYHYSPSYIRSIHLDESSLRLFHYHDAAWSEADECAVDVNEATVTCETSEFSLFALFGQVLAPPSVSGALGRGGIGFYAPVVPTALQEAGSATTTVLTFTINNNQALTDSNQVSLQLNADPRTVRGYAVSLDPAFVGASLFPFSSTTRDVSFALPPSVGRYTLYLKYFSTTGDASPTLTRSIEYRIEERDRTASSTSIAPATSTSTRFFRVLKRGSKGADVLALQRFLNLHGFLVARSGPGSPGQEVSQFGSATSDALRRFQESVAEYILKPQGLKKGTGIFGKSTLQYVNTLQ